MVVLAVAHTLLVRFVLRIIGGMVLVGGLVLEKWSRHSLYHASTNANTHRYRKNPDTMS
jgi:hypothetical protein